MATALGLDAINNGTNRLVEIITKIFAGLGIPPVLFLMGQTIYQSLSLINGAFSQEEIKKIKLELKNFGDDPTYIDAFMKINKLTESDLNKDYSTDNKKEKLKLLKSPLSYKTDWKKLQEEYPELG